MSRYEQLSIGELTSTSQSICTVGVGTKEGSSATIKKSIKVTEHGTAQLHHTSFVFSDTPLTLLDTGEGLGMKMYTFPDGLISIIGASSSTAMTVTSTLSSTLNSGSAVEMGVGSITRTGDLTATEQNFLNVHSHTSSTTINVAGTEVGGIGIGVLAPLDGTSTAIAAFLNFSVPTATDIDANATITLAGNIELFWVNLGNTA